MLPERPLFCSHCGHALIRKFIEIEGHERDVCPACGHITYLNPIPVCACIIVKDDKILLAQRGIEPRKGYWTFPGGFMELDETLAQAAARESWEETFAKVVDLQIYHIFDKPHAGQISFIFRGRLANDDWHPGPESQDVRLFTEEEIPWDLISFGSVRLALTNFLADRKTGVFPVRNLQYTPPKREYK